MKKIICLLILLSIGINCYAVQKTAELDQTKGQVLITFTRDEIGNITGGYYESVLAIEYIFTTSPTSNVKDVVLEHRKRSAGRLDNKILKKTLEENIKTFMNDLKE